MSVDTSFGFVRHFDDFNRSVIGTLDWTINQANSATNFAINTQVNGVVRGTVTNNSRNDRAILYDSFTYRADKGGPMVFEARVAIHTSLLVSVFAGLASRNNVEVPIEWNNALLVTSDPDAVGFYWGASGTSWRCGGTAANVDSVQTTAIASLIPVLDVFQTLRVALNNDGKATFRINGQLVAELVSGCAVISTLLGSKFAIHDDGAAGSFDIDYRYINAGRS